MIREVKNIQHRIKYTPPFTPGNVQNLYNMKNGHCSLVLKGEASGDKPPISVSSENFEHFKTRRQSINSSIYSPLEELSRLQ